MAQTIIVDTTPGYRTPTIYYSQGDIGRTFSIDLQSRFGESLPASPTITIQATKPSGLGFSVASTSISGAVVTFTVTETMSNEAGRFPAELKIVKNSVTLFTANFYIDCEANAHPEGTTDGDIDHIMPKFMSVTTTTLPAGDSATYSFDANTNTATFGIPKGADGSLASQVLAADYSSSKTYAVGDYVYYSGNLYRCTTAITTAEAWTSGHWTQVALANDVSDLKNAIKYNLVQPKVVSNNLFNPNTIRRGAYVYTDGTITQNVDWFYSAPIYIEHADYITKSFGILTFWKADGTFISGVGTGTASSAVPANASYCIVSTTLANLNNMHVNVGQALKPADTYTIKIDKNDIDADLVELDDTILPSVHSDNLFDKTKITEGYYIDANGGIAVASGWFYSDKITHNIVSGATYSKQGVCAVYDQYDNLLNYYAASVTSLTMPNDAAYVRLSRTVALVDTTYIIKGTVVTADLNYYVKFGKEQLDIPQSYIVDVNGGGDYTSLAQCVKEHSWETCDIYVRSGVYDLYTEFSDLYGTDFTNGTHIYEGISVDKHKRFFMDSGAVIKFQYTGSVENIIQYFSPFKFDGVGGELHGGKILASNCRYAIHDDVYSYSSGPSKSVIDGVYVEFNNPARNVCIGGGLGPHSDITVENCIFKQTTDGTPTAIFYHNASEGQAKGSIRITNNYCDNGRIYVQAFGETTLVTTALVTGNRCTSVSKVDGEVDNMELLAFNNVTTN